MVSLWPTGETEERIGKCWKKAKVLFTCETWILHGTNFPAKTYNMR